MIFKNSVINRKAVPLLLAGMAFLFFSCKSIQVVKKEVPVEKPPQDNYASVSNDYKEGNYKDAVISLSSYISDNPDDPRNSELKYYLASSLFYTGKYEDAINRSTEWLREYPDNPDGINLLKLIGDSCLALEQNYNAFFWMLKHYEAAIRSKISKSGLNDISDSIIRVIGKCSVDDLERIKGIDKAPFYFPDIYQRLVNYYLENDDLEKAGKNARLLIEEAEDRTWKSTGRMLLSDINDKIALRGDIRRNAIGCLLPLKGSYSLYGQELLNGIQLGMELFRKKDDSVRIELIIKNTDGSEEETLKAIDDLADNEKVIAIIGPLASVSSSAAVKKAQEIGIPIITFSQTRRITDQGDMVFRNFLTPSKEVDIILKKAVYEMGLMRFGVFYPDTPYGRFFMNLFWDRVEEMGCEITAVESYPPGDTDFAVGIKKMVGLYYPRPESVKKQLRELKLNKELADMQNFIPEEIFVMPENEPLLELAENSDAIPEGFFKGLPVNGALSDADADEMTDEEKAYEQREEEPEPIIDFDAVFIPDNSQNIALIAPQFPFYSIFNVPFLGTSLWVSDEQILKSTSGYIQGAIIPAGFYISKDSAGISDFVKLYIEYFGVKPGLMAANGYDTIKLIRHILDSSDTVNTRADFKNALLETDDYTGVTGTISFDETGEVEKDPVLLTVKGDDLKITGINPPAPDLPVYKLFELMLRGEYEE